MASAIDTGPRKFVIFVDCMGDDDVEDYMEFTREHAYDGTLDAGNPYVTPRVLGSIYTGLNPGEHGLPAVSRYGQDARLRPAAPTLPEIVAESDEHGNVANLGLPFLLRPNVQTRDTFWSWSSGLNEIQFVPAQSRSSMEVPGPAGDLSDLDEDSDLLLGHRFDHIRNTFGAARSLATIQDFDVMFISIRDADSYCHYRYTERGEGEALTDRQFVLREIDKEIEAMTSFGDVFVFGDHGATEMERVFKINRWLMDKGYLAAEIDHDFIEKSRERGTMETPEPGNVISVGTPGVEIDEAASVAISDDPFSGGITLLDGADEASIEALIDDLEDTDYVDHVDRTDEMWSGRLLHECPDLYPFRSNGTYISGNMAAEMGGPEITRSGVHHPTGGYGSTAEVTGGEQTPESLFSIILDDFLGVDPGTVDTSRRQYGAEPASLDDQEVKNRLRDLGYL